MKINELKKWVWDVALEDNPRIPLDAQIALNVKGVTSYTFGADMSLTKLEGDDAGESITVKQFLNTADQFGDKDIDCGHEFAEDYFFSPRAAGRTLWILLTPNEGEVPVESEPTSAEE